MYIEGMAESILPSRRIQRLSAAIAVIGAAGFVLFFALAHLVQPSVDPSWQLPSELALGSDGWIMITAFLALGLGCVGLVIALVDQVPTWPGKIGLVALSLAALGCLLGGVFPADSTNTAASEGTLAGTIHSLGPVLLDGIPIAAVLLAVALPRRGDPSWRRARSTLVVGAGLTVGAAVVLTVSMGVMMPETGQLGPEVLIGWQGRALLLVNALWVAGVGLTTLWVRRSSGGTPDVKARALAPASGGRR